MNRNILPLSVLHFLRDGFYTSFFLLLPFIAQDLSINLAQVGSLESIVNFIAIITALPIAYLAKRIGGMKIMIISLLFYALGFLIVGFSGNYPLVFLAAIVAGLGFSTFSPLAPALLAKLTTSAAKRGRDVGMFMAIGDAGKVIVPLLVTVLISSIGWQSLALLYSTIAIVLFSFFYVLVHKKSGGVQHETKVTPSDWRQLLKHRKTIYALAAGALDQAATSPFFLFLPFLLLEKGIDPGILGAFVSVFFVGTVLSRVLSGRFTDKFGNSSIFIFCEVLMVIGVAFLLILSSPLLIILTLPLVGLFSEGTDAPIHIMLSESADQHLQYDHVFALRSVIYGIVNIVTPLGLGIIANAFGINAAFVVMAGFVGLAIIPAAVYKIRK